MQIYWFGIDFTKDFLFIFYLTTEILRSSLLLRIFECGFWNKKCALTCQETLFWTVRRCEEKWAQKSSFSVKKAQVWFGMIENFLWSAWPLHMKCSFFKVDTMKWLAFFDILIDWLTISGLMVWPNQTEQNFIDSHLAQISYLGEPSPENTCLQIWAHSKQPIFFFFFLGDGISQTEIFVDSDLAQI